MRCVEVCVCEWGCHRKAAEACEDSGDLDSIHHESGSQWWPWSSCLNITGSGSGNLLDDANIGEPMSSPTSISVVSAAPNILVDSPAGLLPCSHLTSYYDSENTQILNTKQDKDFTLAIKKLSNKGYNSFKSSCSEFIENETLCVAKIRGCMEEVQELITAEDSDCESEGKINACNEQGYILKKDISYDKVLSFGIKENINDIKFNSEKTNNIVRRKHNELGKNSSSSTLSPILKEAIALKNDLDHENSVVPVAFSPNLFPDNGSLSLKTCSIVPNVPPAFDSYVQHSVDGQTAVTVLSHTRSMPGSIKNIPGQGSNSGQRGVAITSATWPFQRPHSLRLAICYKEIEDLSEQECDRALEMKCHQSDFKEIDKPTAVPSTIDPQTTDNVDKTNFLNINMSVDSQNNINSDLEAVKHNFSEVQVNPCVEDKNSFIQVNEKNDSVVFSHNDFVESNKNCNNDSVISTIASTIVSSFVPENSLMSPSSDKENNPILLSVRPKIRKGSPLKKHKSPKKSKNSTNENSHPVKKKNSVRSHENVGKDFWEVDDTLPVPSKQSNHAGPRVLQECHLSPSRNTCINSNSFKYQASPARCKTTSKSKSAKDKITVIRNSNDISPVELRNCIADSPQSISKNMSTINDCLGGNSNKDLVSSEIYESHSEEALTLMLSPLEPNKEKHNTSYKTMSEVLPTEITKKSPSELPTPNMTTEDITDYYSTYSEIQSNSFSDMSIVCNETEEVSDYVSITSEIPGLPKDTSLLDINAVSLPSEEDSINVGMTDSVITVLSVGSLESGDPSSMTESHKDVFSDGSESPGPESLLGSPSKEVMEVKYVQLSLSIVLAVVLHAMQSISQFMVEVFLASEQNGDQWY
ncbi:unnamed protein product [Meganyctiphanes norvegica]|uniref:Uncharacterized protein n=1 Tax=Meganyctiphanes norvegica TaxID=48144 RepID=A0AAV2R074_MEGNR